MHLTKILLKGSLTSFLNSSICKIELFNIFREQYAWPSSSSEGIPNMRNLSKDIGKRTGIPCKKYKYSIIGGLWYIGISITVISQYRDQ